MKNENYQISITVNADAKKAFENICNVAGWWTKNIEGTSKKLDDFFTVRFGETFITFKITEFTLPTKMVWLVTDSNVQGLKDKKEWNNTKVDWQIVQDKNEVVITLMHIGLTPAVECYEMCEKGWNFFAGESLKKLINEGKGMPDMPASERELVNS